MKLPSSKTMLIVVLLALIVPTPSHAFEIPFKLRPQENFSFEIALACLAVAILVGMVMGRRKNERMASSYVEQLCLPIMHQFAEAETQVIQDSPSVFKFYASGRRYCQGALFTFRFISRQDVLSLVLSPGQKDTLEIEVNMNESAMPPTVLFIGTPSAAKTIPKEHRDIADLAKKLEPTRDRLATFPVDSLVVYAEHASVFYDVITPVVVDSFLGPALSKYFKYLHASSDYRVEGWKAEREGVVGASGKRAVVRVGLTLPPVGDVEALDAFITFVCLVVDGLGTCKLSAEAVKRAMEVRHKVENSREEVVNEKEKRLEDRRLAKEAEERERLAKLPPQQRAKEKAKRDKVLRERKMRQMVKKL